MQRDYCVPLFIIHLRRIYSAKILNLFYIRGASRRCATGAYLLYDTILSEAGIYIRLKSVLPVKGTKDTRRQWRGSKPVPQLS